MPSLKPKNTNLAKTTRSNTVLNSGISKTKKPSKKAPEKLTIADVANTLKVSYHKNNNAKKAHNPYLNLMFQNLSSTNKPKKVVDDETFELLKFARVVSAWVRRNMPIAPCNKEFTQQLDEFELSLAATNYIFSKYSTNLDNTKISDIKKIGSGTCGHFSKLALNAILGHDNLENIDAKIVVLDSIDGDSHVCVLIKTHGNEKNAVLIDAHSENAEPCLLRDIQDKLSSMGYNTIGYTQIEPEINFSKLDKIEFTPSISSNHKNSKIISSSLTKKTGEDILYKGEGNNCSIIVKYSIQDSEAHYGKLILNNIIPEKKVANIAKTGTLVHIRKNNRSQFIFMDIQNTSGNFSPFKNLFADIPYQYTNSKGETIPSGEEIMNINN